LILITYLLSTREDRNATDETAATTEEVATDIINARYHYADGTYEVAGTITTPTPCDMLRWTVVPQDGGDVEINFTTERENEDEVCAQVLSTENFYLTFDAPQNADITATLNGEEVRFNMIPADEGEDLQADFELKG